MLFKSPTLPSHAVPALRQNLSPSTYCQVNAPSHKATGRWTTVQLVLHLISISRLFISREPVIFSFPVVLDDQVSLSCSAVDFDNNLRYCGNLLAFLFWKSLASLCEILKLSIRAGALHGLQRLHLKRSLNLTSQTYNYASNRHALIYFDYHLHSLNIRTSKSGYHYLRFMLKRLDKVIF